MLTADAIPKYPRRLRTWFIAAHMIHLGYGYFQTRIPQAGNSGQVPGICWTYCVDFARLKTNSYLNFLIFYVKYLYFSITEPKGSFRCMIATSEIRWDTKKF